ncbi:hypothetical protein LEADMM068B1_03030 [Leclercia adecarboxylata]
MNSLTVNHRLPQLRGVPVHGASSFRYERMVSGLWVPCNHSRAIAIVGVWRRKAEFLCQSLIAGSETTTASRYGLSGGSQIPDASYTYATATTMNASALLSNSSANLQS